MAEKDLKYYLEHPDEMPTDPAELEKLANEQIRNALEGGQDQISVDRFAEKDDKADSSPAPKAEEAPKEEVKPPAEEAPKEEKPEGVLAKDGKNVIPYAVLEQSRRREQEAVALATEQAKEIERLKGQSVPDKGADTVFLSDEDLTALEAESPTLAKVIRGQQNALKQVTAKVDTVVEDVKVRVEHEETEVKSEIQQAIDATPKLATWQVAEDQTMWNEAAKQDRVLRSNPLYADVPFEKRFAKVVELTQAAMQVEPLKPEPKPEPKPDPAAVRAAAEAKLRNITTMPRSLSDIPGGAPPAVDERQKVEEMSSVSLGQMFLGMTQEQRDAYLSNL